MPRWANKTDGPHTAIVEAIRKMGFDWIPCTSMPSMGCDGLILARGRVLFCEIKNGSLPPSKRKLTRNELSRKGMCDWHKIPYVVFESVEDAIEVMGAAN